MDNEVAGAGNQYDYGFRIYNPRIARFLSVDPLTSSYPWYTPYQFAGNKPIWAIDLDGLEELIYNEAFTEKYGGSIALTLENSWWLENRIKAISLPEKAATIKIHYRAKETGDNNAATFYASNLVKFDNELLKEIKDNGYSDDSKLMQSYNRALETRKNIFASKGIDYDQVASDLEKGIEHIYVDINEDLSQFKASRAFYHENIEHVTEYLYNGSEDEVSDHKKAVDFGKTYGDFFDYKDRIIIEAGYTDYDKVPEGTTRDTYIKEVKKSIEPSVDDD